MNNFNKSFADIMNITHYFNLRCTAVFVLACVLGSTTAYAGFFDDLNKMKNTLNQLGVQQQTSQMVDHGSPNKQAAGLRRTEVVITATAKKRANVRSQPDSKATRVGQIPVGETVNVQEMQGDWIRIDGLVNSTQISGWTYKPLYSIESTTVDVTAANDYRPNVFYTGYSKDFQEVKKLMLKGDLNGIENFFAEREKTVLKDKDRWEAVDVIGLLRWMERGSLYLDKGDKESSIQAFDNAEHLLEKQSQKSHLEDFFSFSGGMVAGTIIGNEEFSPYSAEGYEKVLMLNYKSIAYLLEGQRKAYNVTRRAIDWQDIEKRHFAEKIKEAKKRLSEEKIDKEQVGSRGNDAWKENYRKLDKIANKVPSAYVNPFGYYIAGIVQEFESRDDRSLRDNARIAYQKALELNPDSKVIKQAVKDMKSRFNKKRRLVHVLVSDGFVPEKKMLQYNLNIQGQVIPIKLSIYEPVPSRVARIEVQSMSGKRLAKLSTIADIEAICLRNQKDGEAFRALRVGLSVVRAIGVNAAARNIPLFGNLLAKKAHDMATPDSRSWMSLPAKIQGARFTVGKNTKKIKIVSYDKHGRRLASKTVPLDKSSDNLVYVRSMDKQLLAQSSKPLWTR